MVVRWWLMFQRLCLLLEHAHCCRGCCGWVLMWGVLVVHRVMLIMRLVMRIAHVLVMGHLGEHAWVGRVNTEIAAASSHVYIIANVKSLAWWTLGMHWHLGADLVVLARRTHTKCTGCSWLRHD